MKNKTKLKLLRGTTKPESALDNERFLQTLFVPDLTGPEGVVILENPKEKIVAIIGTAEIYMCAYPVRQNTIDQNRIPNEPSLTMRGVLIVPTDVAAKWDSQGLFDAQNSRPMPINCNRSIPMGTTMVEHIRNENRRGYTIVDMRRPI